MKRLLVLFVVSVVALTGCKKKDDKKNEADKIRHGEGDGKGTGGGDKKAVGTKDSKPGSGKQVDETPKADPAVIERGAYLSALGGCAMCHTPMGEGMVPDMGKMFGGGFEMEEKGPGGQMWKWRSLNITNHETGIKDWTDEQVMAAIREGKHKDGSRLAPIMPSELYNRLTDDDAKALVAFLRSVPPVDNKVERAPLPMPPEALPPIAAPKNEPIPADDVGKGGYYAGLMHCVMCHTPMTDQGPDRTKEWAGGFAMESPPGMEAMFGTGILYTPNLTSDPETGLKHTEEEIIKLVKTATKKDGTPVNGPMMFYTMSGWGQMTDADAAALAKFIKALPPVKNAVPKSTYKPPAGPPPGPPPAPAPDKAEPDKAEPDKAEPDKAEKKDP